MKKWLILPLISLSLTLVGCNSPKEDDKVHLIVLAGQSGARGKAKVSDLDKDKQTPNENVDIIADGLVMGKLSSIPEEIDDSLTFEVLEPGYGDDGSEFGPEIGMGETLQSRYLKNDSEFKSIIVKYTASGSTFISDWYSKSSVEDDEVSKLLDVDQLRETKDGDPTGPLTSNLYQLIDHTINQLDDLGYKAVIDGMCFVHGEQDAKFDDNMDIYEKALTYFINDFREYVNDEDLPVVITEALTNSAKYSNNLRDIQKKVSSSLDNVSFIRNDGMYSNEYEPWHFGADSNLLIGNYIASDIISHNDTRVIEEILQEDIIVPLNQEIELPQFVKAKYENGFEGYSKIEGYTSSYDSSVLGKQEVKFKTNTKDGLKEFSFNVNVMKDVAYVDGNVNEYSKKHQLLNNLGEVSIIKGEDGLYIGANISDQEIWTDGEKWREGDMGQNQENDDFRVYITDGKAEDRITLCLSSANLLRVYDKGISLDSSNFELEKNNLVYQHKLNSFDYRALTSGIVNDENVKSNGLSLELFISYSDLGISNPNSIKICFNYNNISKVNSKKVSTNNYLVKENGEGNLEENIASYFSINELI